MPKKSPANAQYWPAAFIAIAQVFLGVAAGTFFTGNLDLYKIFVVFLNLTISIIVFFLGRRMNK